MGRSRAAFMVQGAPSGAVIENVHHWAHSEKFRQRPSPAPNQMIFGRGSEAWNGLSMVIVLVWDVPGGCNVTVEAWLETMMGDMSADPNAVVGMLPRRKLMKRLRSLCDYVGAPGAAGMFQHS